jgi:hypothetical protein
MLLPLLRRSHETTVHYLFPIGSCIIHAVAHRGAPLTIPHSPIHKEFAMKPINGIYRPPEPLDNKPSPSCRFGLDR